MVNPKSLENLKSGKRFSDEYARINAEKTHEVRRQKKTMAEVASALLSAQISVDDPKTREALTKMGVDPEHVDLQTIGLARLGQMVTSKNKPEMLTALRELREITGQDTRSMIEAERRQLERERIQFEREKLEFERTRQIAGKESNNGKIDELINGLNELRDDLNNGSTDAEQ